MSSEENVAIVGGQPGSSEYGSFADEKALALGQGDVSVDCVSSELKAVSFHEVGYKIHSCFSRSSKEILHGVR